MSEQQAELDAPLGKKPVYKINKKLRALNMDAIRDSNETRIALAEFRTHDANEATTLVSTILAGMALVVAVGQGSVAATIWTFALIVLVLAALSWIHIGKRNQEAANAVLHYRLNNGHTLLETNRPNANE